jgi:hypothetical protein
MRVGGILGRDLAVSLHAPVKGRRGQRLLWKSIKAARDAHRDPFKARIWKTFGSAPEFWYFEMPIVVDSHANADVQSAE